MNRYITTTTAVTIHREGQIPSLAEDALTLELADEGGGPFFLLSQNRERLRVELAELELLVQAAKDLLAQKGARATDGDG